MNGHSASFEKRILSSNKFEEFTQSSNDVINFKLIRSSEDVLNDDIIFKPEMSHQIFGDSETIFGYKDLKLNIYCMASSMKTYIGIKYSEILKSDAAVKPDNILELLSDKYLFGFDSNIDIFLKHLDKEKYCSPFGNIIHAYSRISEDNLTQNFEIYKITETSKNFLEFHSRIQPFLLYYVDAASYIDTDDEKWNYYILYEKYKTYEGDYMYAFIGYMTIYNYYAYPDKIRPRISQILLLPPFQCHGHGTVLLDTFYRQSWLDNMILDITVEDPSENFQRLRDYVDSRNCQLLGTFDKQHLCNGFSEEMVQEAKNKLKLSKKQIRRVYEILRLKNTDCHNSSEFKKYRIDVKRRLNIPFQKNGRDFEKLRRSLEDNELVGNIMPDSQRLEQLETMFQSCVNEYRLIINRLNLA